MEQIIRQHIFERIHQELPYTVQQITNRITRLGENNQSIRIDHAIIVEQDSHKPILIGQNGDVLRYIVDKSRPALQQLFNCHVHLYLQVISASKAHSLSEQYKMLF